MENQDIAANYRDENSQLVMISQSLYLFRGQISLLFFFFLVSFNLCGAPIHKLIYRSYSGCSHICRNR